MFDVVHKLYIHYQPYGINMVPLWMLLRNTHNDEIDA